jgi:Fe-S-cluster-containing hydrogenase component 2
MIHIDQSESRTYFACMMCLPVCPLLWILSLSQYVNAQSLYSPTAKKITPWDAHIPTRVCDEICAAAMKAFNYSDVEIVRKLRLDSSVSYLKLARDGFFGDSG